MSSSPRARTIAAGSSPVTLFGATAAGAGLAFLTSLALAGWLSPQAFSTYAIVVSVAGLVVVPSDGGLFAAGSRRLLERHDGSGTTVAALGLAWLGSLVVAAVLAAVVALTGVLPDDVATTLLVLAPAAGGAGCAYFLEQVCKGTGDLAVLSATTVTTRIASLLVIGALVLVGPAPGTDAAARSAVLAVLGAAIVLAVVALALLRPTLAGAVAELRSGVWRHHRSFGRALFVGRTANVLAYRSDVFLIAVLGLAIEAGPYVLAVATVSPVVMLGQAFATRWFTSQHGRPLDPLLLRRLWVASAALAAACAALGVGVAWVLGPSYDLMWSLMPLVAVAALLQSAFQPWNSWLLASADGPSFRRVLLVAAVANLTANIVLITLLGALGAAVASIIGNGTYAVLTRRLYRREVTAGDPREPEPREAP